MSKLFRPTLIRQDESSSGNYLVNSYIQDKKYSDRFLNTNLSGSYSYRYGDKPYLTSTQQLRIDWSKFENHTFFHSAVANVNEAFDKIVNYYPFDKSESEVEKFEDEMTGFEKYILDSFPKNKGYLNLSNSEEQFIEVIDKRGVNIQGVSEASDGKSVLDPAGKPFSIEFFIKVPEEANSNQIILQKKSNENRHISIGIMQTTNTSNCNVIFTTRYFANKDLTVIGEIKKGVWNHCACYYYYGNIQEGDHPSEANKTYMLINDTLESSLRTVDFQERLSFPNQSMLIGSGSSFNYTNDNNVSLTFTPDDTLKCSIDDLKIYHRNNLAEKIIKNKYYQAYPGVNDDSLKLFLKFNEPEGEYTGNDIVLDSSGNALHSRIENYTSQCRITGSDVPVTAETLERNPILFPEYPGVDKLNQELLLTASLYDEFNPNLITKLIPQHYFQDATIFRDFNQEFEKLGSIFKNITNNTVGNGQSDLPSMQLLIKMLLTYAKFFDEIKIMIDGVTNFMYTEYDEYDTTPDVFLLEKAKLTNTILPQIMSDGSIDQLFKGINLSNTKTESTKSLVDVQKIIWRRILSEAGKFKLKKGTVDSIKGVFRNAGIEPDNILDFREYGGSKIKSLEGSKETKKDVIYFLSFDSSINKEASSYDTNGYPLDMSIPYIKSGYLSGSRTQPGVPLIKGSLIDDPTNPAMKISDEESDGLFTSGSFSYEGIYSWPRGYLNATESLARIHTTGSIQPFSYEGCIFNLMASDEKIQLDFFEHTNDSNVKSLFLTGANIFDKDIWTISFGKKDKREFDNALSSSYFLRAAKQSNGEVLETFETSSFFRDDETNSLLKNKSAKTNASGSFIVIGSQSYQDTSKYLNANPSSTFTKFTGFVTGIKFFSRFVTEKEWLTHAKSYTNYGVSNPKINYNFEKLESGSFERLVLHTDTKQKTKESDSLGNIRLFDFSKNNLHFEGKNFPESSLVLKPTRVNYEVLSDKFDINYSKNKVRIRSFQDEKNKENGYYSEFAPVHEIITSEESIDDNRLSLDMSVMKGVNRNILNAFSSLDILETGIGSPNLLFSENYPVLEDIRNLYFENFTEKINLNKYRDLFKWIDNSFTEVVYSIVPRTTNFLGINFIYESHVLERHKYKYLHDNIYKKSLERVYPEGEYPEVLDLELPEVNVEVIASETNGNASSLASGERLENSSVKSIPSKTMITIII